MKILVAGKGFIGSKIGEKLEEQHDVKYLDRSDADFQEDVTQSFEIDQRFDVLIHTIGLAPGFYSADRYREVHVEGTRNLVDAVETDRIVYLSALGAGEVDHSFFRTKQKAEQIVKSLGSDYVILRPSTVYGEGNKLLETIRKMSFTRVFPNIRTETQPIRRGDLVEIAAESVERFDGRTLNVAGEKHVSIGELARHLYSEEGRKCFLLPYPRFLLEAKLVGLSFLPPPFQRENIEILRSGNTTEENDAEEIIDLQPIF